MLNKVNMALVEKHKGPFVYAHKESYEYAGKRKPGTEAQPIRAVAR
jgi:hypothetical protein